MPNPIKLDAPEVLRHMRMTGAYGQHAEEALAKRVAAQEAEAQGLTASAEEVQEAAGAYRAQRGLEDAAAFQDWLRDNELSPGSFEEAIEQDVLVSKLLASGSELGDAALAQVSGGTGPTAVNLGTRPASTALINARPGTRLTNAQVSLRNALFIPKNGLVN